MINSILETLAQTIRQSTAAAPLLCVLAGLLTSLLPCSLSSLPLIIGYVSAGGDKTPRRALLLSALFAFGSAVTFTTLGLIASLAGRMLSAGGKIYYLAVGVLLVLMALQTWEVIQILPATNLVSKSKRRGAFGAFIAGMLAGLFSSPCATPVLVALLALVGSIGVARAALLLFCFSLGHGILTIFVGSMTGAAQKLVRSDGYGRTSKLLRLILGSTMLIFALYMLYQGF